MSGASAIIGRLVGLLELDSTGMGQGLQDATNKIKKNTSIWKKEFNSVSMMFDVMVAAWPVKKILEVGDAFLQAGKEVDKYNSLLKTAIGSEEAAGESKSFLRQESERLGLVYWDQIRSFGQLAAATKGTNLEGEKTQKIWTGVAEAGVALRLSTDDINGTMRALTQIMSKGKLQAEEIRGQIGERLPGAFRLAAESMNMTTTELSKALEQGEVYADDFLPRFADALHQAYGKDAQEAAGGLTAQLNRMDDAWKDLTRGFMEAGGIELATNMIEAFIPVVRRAAEELRMLGGWFGEIVQGPTVLSVLEEQARGLKLQIQELKVESEGGFSLLGQSEEESKALNEQIALLENQLSIIQKTIETEKNGFIEKEQRERALAGVRSEEPDSILARNKGMAEAGGRARTILDEMIKEQYKADIKAREKAAEESLRIHQEFLKDYDKATMDSMAYSLKALNEEYKLRKENKEDEMLLENWFVAELVKIHEGELENEKKTQDKIWEFTASRLDKAAEERQNELDAHGRYLEALVSKENEMSEQIIELSQRTSDAIESNFSDFYSSLFDGVNNVNDLWESMWKSMKQIAADYMGQITREVIFGKQASQDGGFSGGLLSGVVSGIAGLFDGGGLSASQVAIQTGAPATIGGASVLAAHGAVLPGISAYRNSILTQPTYIPLAAGGVLAGEAGKEGVFPLADIGGDLGVKGMVPQVNFMVINNHPSARVTQSQDDQGNPVALIEQIESGIMSRMDRGTGMYGYMNSHYRGKN